MAKRVQERVLRWETDSRYYTARLRTDLLGDWVLDCAWGGRYNNLGGAETTVVLTKKRGEEVISDLHKRRTSRHYALVADRLLRH